MKLQNITFRYIHTLKMIVSFFNSLDFLFKKQDILEGKKGGVGWGEKPNSNFKCHLE